MLDQYEQKIVDDIGRVGWSLIAVQDDPEGPGFVYSIGMMHSLDHAEVILFGLDVKLMARLINTIGGEIRQGRRFEDLGLFDGIVERYACKCVSVDKQHHTRYLGYAMWHRRHVGKPGDLRVIQILWPDKAGLFPDERGCEEHTWERQPLLHLPWPPDRPNRQ